MRFGTGLRNTGSSSKRYRSRDRNSESNIAQQRIVAETRRDAGFSRTPEERAAYWIGEKAGEQAPRDAKLLTPAELNMMAQKYFEQQGSANKQNWDLAFEKGYKEGSKKTHPSE